MSIQFSETTFVFNSYCFDLLGHVYQGLLNYITNNVYNQFKYSVIETYHKAVEYLDQDVKTAIPPRPALSLDPLMPITLDSNVGNLLMQTSPGIGMQQLIYDPIYEDANIRVTPVFTRFEHPIIANMWFQSIYQAIEMQIRLRFIFANQDRWLKLYNVTFYSPLPSIVLNNGSMVQWNSSLLPLLYSITNQQVYGYPVYISPLVQLQSITDESSKEDKSLPEYKIAANFNLQFSIPTGFLINSLFSPQSIQFTIGVGSIGWNTPSSINLNGFDNTSNEYSGENSYNLTSNNYTGISLVDISNKTSQYTEGYINIIITNLSSMENTTLETTSYIDFSNATDEYGILGDSTSYYIDLTDIPNATNMESESIEITTSISGFGYTVSESYLTTLNLKQVDANLWFAFSVSENIPSNNILYLDIPSYNPSLNYILTVPASQIPNSWSIQEVMGVYKLFIVGPILENSKFVLYGFNNNLLNLTSSYTYV